MHRCLHTGPQVSVALTVSGVGNDGIRTATLSVTPGTPGNTTLALPATDRTLAVRVLADRTIIETYVGGGRGVVTSPVGRPPNDLASAKVFLRNTDTRAALMVESLEAWELGCGWASYPN